MMAKKDKITKESFDEFIEREYGKGIITSANTIIERKRDILKTVLSLDLALTGGIPSGTTVLLSGKPKSGKTSLCLQILKNAIEDNRSAFYMDIERRCSQSLLKTIQGLDTSKLKIIKSTPEQILNAEAWLNILERTIKDNKRAVIVIDSIAMLSTLAEMSEAVGDNRDMAGTPKLLASFFRKTQQVIDDNDCILIFISQLITNREQGGKKYVERGGMAVQYANSIWLNVNWTKLWDKDVETNSPHGQDMMVSIICSALGKPFIPCSIPLRFGSGVDYTKDILINAENMGIIERSGAWYSVPMFLDDKKEALRFQGFTKLYEFFKNNKDKLIEIDDNMRKVLLPNN